MTASTALATSLAGCTGRLASSRSYRLVVHNETTQSRTVRVTVRSRSSSVVQFERTLELSPHAQSDTFSIYGNDPYTVTIGLESGYQTSFPWSGTDCGDTPFRILVRGEATVDRLSASCDDWF